MQRHLMLMLGLASIVALGQTAQAQLPFSVGFRLGLNIGNATYDPEPQLASGVSKGSRLGFMAGALVELGIAGPAFIQIEPMFVQKGTKFEGPGGKITSKANYFAIPVLLKAKFGPGHIKPYAFVGPDIGINLTSKSVLEVTGQPEQESDDAETTSSIDFALDFGGGVQVDVAPRIAVALDARYSLGLTDVFKDPAGTTGDQKIKTNGIQILAAIILRLGH